MFKEAISAIKANRLRSFLTMLGMIIGVGAVILIFAVGAGAQLAVKKQIDSMGSNLFIVLAGATTSGGLKSGTGSAPTLTVIDAQAIGELSAIEASAPVVSGTAQLGYASNNWSTVIYGITPEYMIARDWHIANGTMFSDAEVRSMARVAVIGQTVAKNLFGNESAVGQVIKIGQSPYVVIGELESKGQSLDGRDQDDTVLIPLTTAQRQLFGTKFSGSVRFIMVKAKDDMSEAETQMTSLLRQRHKIKENSDNDFTIRNLSAMAQMAANTTRIMTIMLGAIASISLLVGGIGIMNIMLVSVTERTKEIGIRMAIGAKQRDILLQFLLEAVVISLIGCLLGTLIGIGGALALEYFFDIDISITLFSVIIAFAVSCAIGIFFGYYPARKAARMEPIEALRYQ